MVYIVAAGMLAMTAVMVILTVQAGLWLALRQGWKPFACVSLGMLLLASWLVMGLSFSGQTLNLGLWQQWRQELHASLDASMLMYRRLGWNEADLTWTAKVVSLFFIDAILSWLLLAMGALAWLAYLWQRRMTPELPGAKVSLQPFSRWKVPEHFIWAFILALAGMLLGFRHGHWMLTAAVNLFVLLSVLYVFNGTAVAVFQLEKWRAPKVFQILVFMAVCLFPGLLMLLMLVGVFDTWWDWRGRVRQIS